MEVRAYLEMTMRVDRGEGAAAASVYSQYTGPFLTSIEGALLRNVSSRGQVVRVLHGFSSREHAEAYLRSPLHADVVLRGLLLWRRVPEVRVYGPVWSRPPA